MEKPTKTAKELLADRRTGVFSVTPDATVFSALKLLAEKDVGVVIVLEGEKLVGILSERDYARKVELKGKTAKDTRVREVMTSQVVSVSPQHTVDQCIAIMKEKRFRHLPVVEGGRVIGVLSSRDVLEEEIAEEEQLIKNLEQERLYIMHPDPSSY
jgi:CBS domain-containing protein